MVNSRKTAGVLGGMGPDATVDFMSKVIALTPAERDQDHVPMLVDHNPAVPNRQEAILADGEDPGAAIAVMGRRLESFGADFLVMVCNSAHAFVTELQSTVSIPLVSIIDASVAALPGGVDAVGVMATDGCVASGVYQAALQAAGMTAVIPDSEQLEALMRLITRVKSGDQSDDVAQGMSAVAQSLVRRGAQAIIAGCTEIPLVLSKDRVAVPLISSTDALAEKTVALALGTARLPDA